MGQPKNCVVVIEGLAAAHTWRGRQSKEAGAVPAGNQSTVMGRGGESRPAGTDGQSVS